MHRIFFCRFQEKNLFFPTQVLSQEIQVCNNLISTIIIATIIYIKHSWDMQVFWFHTSLEVQGVFKDIS